MQCKHPLVKKLRKAGASTKSAVRVIAGINNSNYLKHTYRRFGDDISYLFIFDDQPEGHTYWREVNERMGY